MEVKKSKKASLENRRSSFFLLGLVFILALSLMAFEYRAYDTKYEIPNNRTSIPILLEDEIIPISVVAPPPPPITRDIFVLVDDKTPENPDEPVEIEKPRDKIISSPEPIPVDFGLIEHYDDLDKVETIVEVMPEFPGGQKALLTYLGESVIYPVIASDSGIEGVVYVQFIVEKDGSISNVEILKGIGGGCDQEAIRVIKSMPIWSPGRQQGHPVRVQYRAPIRFVLR